MVVALRSSRLAVRYEGEQGDRHDSERECRRPVSLDIPDKDVDIVRTSAG
jgi:hypothetical protein